MCLRSNDGVIPSLLFCSPFPPALPIRIPEEPQLIAHGNPPFRPVRLPWNTSLPVWNTGRPSTPSMLAAVTRFVSLSFMPVTAVLPTAPCLSRSPWQSDCTSLRGNREACRNLTWTFRSSLRRSMNGSSWTPPPPCCRSKTRRATAMPRTDPGTTSDTSPRATAASRLGTDGMERVQGRRTQVIRGPERGRGLDERPDHRGKRILARRPVFDGAPDSAR